MTPVTRDSFGIWTAGRRYMDGMFLAVVIAYGIARTMNPVLLSSFSQSSSAERSLHCTITLTSWVKKRCSARFYLTVD